VTRRQHGGAFFFAPQVLAKRLQPEFSRTKTVAPPGISPDLFWKLDKVADAVNPVLTLWALLLLWRHARLARARGEAFAAGRTLGVWVGCILAVYVAAHVNRWLHLWPGHKYFPSGHLSYALCVVTLGAALERRSLLFTAPLAALYALLIVQLGYHDWLDIGGALLLAPALTLLILRRASQRAVPTS
jgi:hypothetical protein